MARNFQSASSEYLAASVAPVTAVPLTMSCFMRRTSSSGSRTLMAIDRVSAIDRFRLGVTSGNKLFSQSVNSSISKTAIHPTATTLGKWHHACGVFSSSTLRQIYTDGGTPTSNSSAITPSGLDGMHLAAVREGGLGITRFFTGDLAEVALWRVALSEAEIGWLALGKSPLSLTHRLGDLVMAQDLIRPINRPGIGPTFSAVGSSVSKHPRVILSGSPSAVGYARPSEQSLRVVLTTIGAVGLSEGQSFLPGAMVGQAC